MIDLSHAEHQIRCVTNFEDLISMPFIGKINAACWTRELVGDFSEIIQQIELHENIAEINQEELRELELSDQGQLAREILLNDLQALKNLGASPVLNLIKCYERDDAYPFFPTDVYSFHVDRSPIPTDTFLCTYHGDSSDIIPNSQAIQKVLVPEIREELRKLYGGAPEGFEAFLSEYFFDLHYQPKPKAPIINLGIGHLWKLAVDHPESQSFPCIHRAPNEITGQHRLLLIC
ncbi:hypothetical protein NQT66_10205 [Cellulophaga baltica]|uniref:hypothetical protein n=1 Tax=Cellulophaga baltica TaxID=76594 RepID=UPI002147F4B0|nr:hypothetical protein [Cellulophaga baltica]MCR1025178.1 hypothetical protein [Cellulophaga baltica]